MEISLKEFHQKTKIIVGHVHMPMYADKDKAFYKDVHKNIPNAQVDIPKLKKGSVNTIFLYPYTPRDLMLDPLIREQALYKPNNIPIHRPIYSGDSDVKRTLRDIDAVYQMIKSNSDTVELALSVKDMERINEQNKIAIFLFLVGSPIAEDLAVLRCYYQLGARGMKLIHQSNKDWIDTDGQQTNLGGLGLFGEKVVREMNNLGMVIDLAHSSEQAMQDVFNISQDPVIISHSLTKKVCNIQRNVSDKILRLLAQNGGVLGIHVASHIADFECIKKKSQSKAYQTQMRRLADFTASYGTIKDPYKLEELLIRFTENLPEINLHLSNVEKIIDHIDHVKNLIGMDHIAIGTDYGGITDTPSDMRDISQLLVLTTKLFQRGYSEEEVRKILSGNLYRVLKSVLKT